MTKKKKNGLEENPEFHNAIVAETNTEQALTADDLSDVEEIGAAMLNQDLSNWQKPSLESFSNRELIDWEKLSYIVCQRIEKSVSQYTGGYNTNDKRYQRFADYNYLHERIIDEMERRVDWRLKNCNEA